ncbi:MAG: hypothetical protein HYY95_22040, partial [Candidatus Rokubacteria bacterium]|nr:hypothetical protein [Candidatus Rokubacteria bacterium]
PVNHLDPSGYFFSKLWKKLIGPILGIVVGVVVGYATGNPFLGALAGGAVAGAVGVAAHGGNPEQILAGAVIGMTLAGFGAGLGQGLYDALGPFITGTMARAMASGALAGAATGAMSAAISGSDPGLGAAYGAATAAVLAAAVHGGYKLADWLRSSGIAEAQAHGDTGIEVGARPLASGEGNSPVGSHKVLRYRTGDDLRYAEMAPEAGNIKVYEGPLSEMTGSTQGAVKSGSITWQRTTVNMDILMRAIEGYRQLFEGQPYRWYSFNSNYFVNSIVSAAGGEPATPGVFAPAFAPGPGRVLLAPVPGY